MKLPTIRKITSCCQIGISTVAQGLQVSEFCGAIIVDNARTYRLMLVGQDHLALDGLQAIFSQVVNVETVGVCHRMDAAIRFAQTLHPALVIIDSTLAAANEFSALNDLRKHASTSRILVVANAASAWMAQDCLQHGASGFVFSNGGKDELLVAIRALGQGAGVYLSREAAFVQPHHLHHAEPITSREREVLELIAKGYQGKAIADELFISLNTVKFHRKNLLSKAGVRNAVQLVDWSRKQGLVRS